MIVLSLIALYLTKKISDYICPVAMNRFYIKVGLYALKLYAPVCVIVSRVYNGYKAFVMDHTTDETPALLCIIRGQVMHELTGPDVELLPMFFEHYDLVLYKERINENAIHNYKYTRLDKTSSLANLPPPSTVQFEDITVQTNGKKYTIDFGINNFYVVGNILCDKEFLQWYLQTYFKADLVEPYTCTIMDADINFITVDASNHIVIRTDGYDIISEKTQ